MVRFCCVPNCSNRSDREAHLSYFGLPLKNKTLLKRWVHVICRKNLPLNKNTRICSEHFVNARGRRLYPNEAPSLLLPCSTKTKKARAEPKDRSKSVLETESFNESAEDHFREVATQTEQRGMEGAELLRMKEKIAELEGKVNDLDIRLNQQLFRLSSIKDEDAKVAFYTGFPSFSCLEAFFEFLEPAASCLIYSKKQEEIHAQTGEESKRCRPRSLLPIEELFLTLVRLRHGLMEQDLAYRFNVSQSTVSRITCTWINFLYLKLKEIPIWPLRDLVRANMPQQFKEQYPTTRVIIDATEIYIEQPHLPELQQMTFSNYKNDNTFKALIGISPDGTITFVSSLFPGSISDKALTRMSGILDLLESGDSVMADRGFDIEEDLILRGVRLNIPPYLRGKKQLSEKEVVVTRRIASLRIHVERAMERIKNFHIFDKSIPVALTDIADRIFFVCCALSNFQPPLL